MGKLKLQVDELRVESFHTSHARPTRGTVAAHVVTFGGSNGCWTCDPTLCVRTCGGSCLYTCGGSCDNSLDYCTCACSDQGLCTDDCTVAGPGCHHHSDEGSCPC